MKYFEQTPALEGQLGEIERHWVRSYANGTAGRQRDIVTVSTAANAPYTFTIASGGLTYSVTFSEGAVGTIASKVSGLAAALNNSEVSELVNAWPRNATSFFVEARLPSTSFVTAAVTGNLTVGADVAFVAQQSVPFGLAVAIGSSDTSCKRPTSIADKIIGVAVHTHADNFGGGYQPQSSVSVLRWGCIVVRPETNVAAEDPVFVRAVATGTQRAGAFRNSADGATTTAINGRFLTTASAGGYAWVAVDTITTQGGLGVAAPNPEPVQASFLPDSVLESQMAAENQPMESSQETPPSVAQEASQQFKSSRKEK